MCAGTLLLMMNQAWRLIAPVLVPLLLLLMSCDRQVLHAADTTAKGLSRRSALQVYPANPVIQAGDFIDKGLWNDPCVLLENGRFVMYITSSTKEPFKPPVLPFRAVSSDGIHWQLDPTRPLLRAMGTPFVSLETPSVVKHRGGYHLYYSGIYPEGRMPMMAIGHATSSDGIVWRSDPAPVLSATGNAQDWNGFLVGEPGVVVSDEKVLLFFSAVGARSGGKPPQLQSIGLAVSDDGTRFREPRIVLQQSALFPPEKGFVGYSTPAALVYGDAIHLFFDVAQFFQKGDPEWQQVALHHAVSRDQGRTFVEDRAPFLAREDSTWTSGEILAPTALIQDKHLLIWFAGHVRRRELAPLIRRGLKGKEFGIGLASADTSWLN